MVFSNDSDVRGFPQLHNLIGKFVFEFREKVSVLVLVSQVVREHYWYLVYYGIEPAAICAEHCPVNDHVAVCVYLKKLQGIVLVDWARQYVQEFSLQECVYLNNSVRTYLICWTDSKVVANPLRTIRWK